MNELLVKFYEDAFLDGYKAGLKSAQDEADKRELDFEAAMTTVDSFESYMDKFGSRP